jgi:glycosyltransferase involved in cell wall biosynthesis
MWGLGRFRDLVSELRPDVAAAINDPWIAHRFAEFTDAVPFAAYIPVDAKNIPHPICEAMNGLDLAIFYTQFGAEECRRNGYKGNVAVIPHGVDTDVYRPVDKADAREALRMSRDIPEDSFIVGNVNRNQPRKRLDLTIEYFAEWVHCYHLQENIYLYLHCAQVDAGWDLAQLAYYYGIDKRLMLPPEDAVTSQRGWPEDFMRNVYSAFDVQLSTTEGEGWGLPQIEGMACGVPQIMPQYSGLGEWAAGAAYFVPVTSHVTHTGINTIGGVPDKTATVKALDHLYRNRQELERYAGLALARAREDRFNWDRIAQQFSITLYDCMIHGKKRREEIKQHAAA